MKKFSNWPIYLGYITASIVFFLAAIFLPVSEIFKEITAVPGIGALCLFLNQLWREERAHERVIELQNKQQDFVLGTASHMSSVAYDKHVEFCEEYMNRVQKGFQELLRDGPSKNAMDIGRELVIIRKKHSCWLTKEIEESLQPFEQALIKIGSNEHYLQYTKLNFNTKSKESKEKFDKILETLRKEAIAEIYKTFGLILGHQDLMDENEDSIYIGKVIDRIRDILGINILTELRIKTAELAIKRISDI